MFAILGFCFFMFLRSCFRFLKRECQTSKIQNRKQRMTSTHTKQQQQQMKSIRNPSVETDGYAKPICKRTGSVNEKNVYIWRRAYKVKKYIWIFLSPQGPPFPMGQILGEQSWARIFVFLLQALRFANQTQMGIPIWSRWGLFV